ncbi:MAG: sigma-70 family RNA polymerase sigma factor [Planctomycetes bacterium]|nr:sigma-70 family RNA polymerase sigma factor [Planctomycetota bacterium]
MGSIDEEDPIKSLVNRAQEGDRAAFEELVTKARQGLLASVRLRIGAHLRAKLDPEDVIQETFLKAFQSLERFQWQGKDSFDRWLQGIAENLILDAAKRERVRQDLQIPRDPPGESTTASKHLRREERFERLKKSIEGLSPDYQKVILLARIDGLKIDEIAERMDRSPSAVKNLLFRAMKELRRSFGDTESLHLPQKNLRESSPRDGAN